MELASSKKILLQLYQQTQKNEVSATGAQLSYYFIISIFPFFIFLLTLLDYTPLTDQNTLQQLAELLPETVFAVVEQIVLEITRANNASLLSFGILGTIWTASRGTYALIRSINKAYETIESRSFLKLNMIGITATFALALAIMFSLGLMVFGKIIGTAVFQSLGMETLFFYLWSYLRYLIPFMLIFLIFSLLYLFAPSLPLRFRDVYPGAVFATLGWIVSSQLFAYYVNNFGNFFSTYGSLGGIIVFLVWLYISSVVILLGGEINAALFNSTKNRNHFF
ncbi:MAG TPA: YihY/virulence factor BrkB family protein [Desulfotomaculum sp.]|nr:MAG: ribonuclease [Peptococcaceae bacterium BRH_c8a]KJS71541.1 MAG: ribonuclease [Desulfotomaculum sp. BICA1-6]HBX23037.1 YihY/virulence factor BrkB family protein [Desulfotomaculum sp.]